MAIRALNTAGTGMAATLFKLDVIANNLSNASTTGFKKSRADFQDNFYEYFKLPGVQDSQGKLTPVGIHVGLGTKISGTAVDHDQGSLEQTGNQLDVAIAGDGFFQIQDPTQILYTRAGAFSVNADGDLVVQSAERGRLVEPAITIPTDATEVVISDEGVISVRQPGTTQLTQVGQLQTARFVNPQGLIQVGDSLFAESESSGPPLTGLPGQEGRGLLRQGFLEASNVEPVRELVGLIKTQRNFELNSESLRTADEALQLLGNLRRF